MRNEKHEHIYESINGFLEKQDERYPNEFEAGSELSEVQEKILAAKLRILDACPECEDDLFEITDGYEHILHKLCLIMAGHVSEEK